MSVRRAQIEIDAAEFAEWMAFGRFDPYGEERADLRAGIVAATIANVFRKKGTRALKAADFMPRFRSGPRREGWRQMKATLTHFAKLWNKRWRKLHGGKDVSPLPDRPGGAPDNG